MLSSLGVTSYWEWCTVEDDDVGERNVGGECGDVDCSGENEVEVGSTWKVAIKVSLGNFSEIS